MSDASMSKAPWWALAIYKVGAFFVWLFEQRPVLIRRSEYQRLKDNDLLIDLAHQKMADNGRLRSVLDKIEYASRKDSLTDHERLQSVRTIVCAAISKSR